MELRNESPDTPQRVSEVNMMAVQNNAALVEVAVLIWKKRPDAVRLASLRATCKATPSAHWPPPTVRATCVSKLLLVYLGGLKQGNFCSAAGAAATFRSMAIRGKRVDTRPPCC